MPRKRRQARKVNCWEYTGCGRGPNGPGAGTCPAATETTADGVNCGVNGGRSCWTIAGTFCDGRLQGTYAAKIDTCLRCEFCRNVLDEEQRERAGARGGQKAEGRRQSAERRVAGRRQARRGTSKPNPRAKGR